VYYFVDNKQRDVADTYMMVILGDYTTLQCTEGPREVKWRRQLHWFDIEYSEMLGNNTSLVIGPVTKNYGGRYYCYYQTQDNQYFSELVVLAVYGEHLHEILHNV